MARTKPIIKSQRGFSRLELMVVFIVFAVILGVFLNRLAYYQEAAERANMEYQIRSMKSALRFKIASLLVSGRVHEYPSLLKQNPVDWLEDKPANYAGAINSTEGTRVEPGTWYFDTDTKILVYVIRNGEGFQGNKGGRKQVQLRLELVLDDVPNGQTGKFEKVPSAVKLHLVEPYQWF